METENMIGNSRVKLTRKNLDMVAANNVKMAGAGFQGDTNVLILITQDAVSYTHLARWAMPLQKWLCCAEQMSHW